MGRAHSEDSFPFKGGAVARKVPRGILPTVSAVVVGAVDVTVSELSTFATNKIVIDSVGVGALSLSELDMSYLSCSLQC